MTAEGVAAQPARSVGSAAARTWWGLERSARSLDRFRVAAGAGLSLHVGLAASAASGAQAWLAYAALTGALAMTLGVWARAAAALLYAAMLALPPPDPRSGAWLEPYAPHVVALMLCLMPIGRTLRLLGPARRETEAPWVSGVAASVLLLYVLALYFGAALGTLALPAARPELALVLPAIAVAFVLNGPLFGRLGVALQLGTHGYLALQPGAQPVVHLMLASTALLFASEPPRDNQARAAFDAGAAAAVAFGVLFVLVVLGTLIELPFALAARQVLGDLGALKPPP